MLACVDRAHQGGFTQQFAASDQVSDGDVEIRVAAAPVGDLGEGMSGEELLQRRRLTSITEQQTSRQMKQSRRHIDSPLIWDQ